MKMVAYQSKPADAVMPAQMQRAYVGGQLEVVLTSRCLGMLSGVVKKYHSIMQPVIAVLGHARLELRARHVRRVWRARLARRAPLARTLGCEQQMPVRNNLCTPKNSDLFVPCILAAGSHLFRVARSTRVTP